MNIDTKNLSRLEIEGNNLYLAYYREWTFCPESSGKDPIAYFFCEERDLHDGKLTSSYTYAENDPKVEVFDAHSALMTFKELLEKQEEKWRLK